MKLADMTWEEAKGIRTAIVPVGSIEQHGPHLPLSTDSLIVESVSEFLSQKLKAVITPVIAPGVSFEHLDFHGTLTLKEETLLDEISEVCSSLRKHGVEDILVVNGHGGNRNALLRLKIPGVKYLDIIRQIPGYDHAGEIETSLMLYIHPEKVRKHAIRKHEFRFPGKGPWRTIEHSKSGVLGDPTLATAEKGKAYFERITSGIISELGHGN
ncbi:MAG: creatininase family protein [Candidatus Altiarchaeota archaeon]|nr:creatininase family protein [Candidatus Altiarchaeota archaeon]